MTRGFLSAAVITFACAAAIIISLLASEGVSGSSPVFALPGNKATELLVDSTQTKREGALRSIAGIFRPFRPPVESVAPAAPSQTQALSPARRALSYIGQLKERDGRIVVFVKDEKGRVHSLGERESQGGWALVGIGADAISLKVDGFDYEVRKNK